jgi:hypothetical protein
MRLSHFSIINIELVDFIIMAKLFWLDYKINDDQRINTHENIQSRKQATQN